MQAADGQLVYLDHLATRLLLTEFGTWAAVPPALTVPIIELTSQRHDTEASAAAGGGGGGGGGDGARKNRFKALAHVPLACPFQV